MIIVTVVLRGYCTCLSTSRLEVRGTRFDACTLTGHLETWETFRNDLRLDRENYVPTTSVNSETLFELRGVALL